MRDIKSEYVLQRELKPDLKGSIQFLLEDGLGNYQICCLYFRIAGKITYRELSAILEESDIPKLIDDEEGVMIVNPGMIKTGRMQIVFLSLSSGTRVS